MKVFAYKCIEYMVHGHPTSPEGVGIRRASSHPLNWVQVGHMWRSIVLCTAAVLNYCSRVQFK